MRTMRTMRTMAGPSPLARAGWIAGGGNKRCMSTVYAESHEYLTKVWGGSNDVCVCVCVLRRLGCG